MTTDQRAKLNAIADRLAPIAGFLMGVALSNGRIAREPEIHEEGCDCQVCRAFLGTQQCMNELEALLREDAT